jgi:hypothetical protein
MMDVFYVVMLCVVVTVSHLAAIRHAYYTGRRHEAMERDGWRR